MQLSVSAEEVQAVEKATRRQALCKIWFDQRAGRTTASKMYSVVHTSETNPSVSLIKAICYPEAFSFSSKATRLGQKQEKLALSRYENSQSQHHESLKISASGLILNPKWPFLGASPNGIVNCSCCSKGILEIKCPYKHRGKSIMQATADKDFCLDAVGDHMALKRRLPHYYPVQAQLHVCDVDFCDFCVCLFDLEKDDIFIGRITKDNNLWKVCEEKCEDFLTK